MKYFLSILIFLIVTVCQSQTTIEDKFQAAITSESTGDYSTAITLYESCIEGKYKTDECHLGEFKCWRELESMENAFAIGMQGIELNPNHQNLIVAFVAYSISQNKAKFAIGFLEKTLNQHQESFALHYGLAIAYDAAEKYNQSEQQFKLALVHRRIYDGTEYFEAWLGQAQHFYDRGIRAKEKYRVTKDEKLKDAFKAESDRMFSQAIAVCQIIDKDVRPNDQTNLSLLHVLYTITRQKDKAKELEGRLD
ncbi:MAG: hypothetical protein QNK23_10805 [Crocinitomicaceae bacterium]|nr:hypothetical protein [Crocinitomicaceae bacterium]